MVDTIDLTKFIALPIAAQVYQFVLTQPLVLSHLADMAVTNNKIITPIPAQSVTTFVLRGMTAIQQNAPAVNNKVHYTVRFVCNRDVLRFQLPIAGNYRLTLFTGNGRIAGSISGQGRVGNNTATISRLHLSNGVYNIQVRQNGTLQSGVVHVVE
jgi:hypothetical protein